MTMLQATVEHAAATADNRISGISLQPCFNSATNRPLVAISDEKKYVDRLQHKNKNNSMQILIQSRLPFAFFLCVLNE